MTIIFNGINLLYDCLGYDNDGNLDQGVITVNTSLAGEWLNKTIDTEPITVTTSLSGDYIEGLVLGDNTITITTSIPFDENDLIIERLKAGWVKWSDIGSIDFTIGRSNVAGEMPIPQAGSIYDLIKLSNKVIIYGQNGVVELLPHGNAWGMREVYSVGLKSRHAVCGTDYAHYFIDQLGQMWQVTDTMSKLDYSEFLSQLTYPIMSWDNEKDLIYICDGTIGFVYSPTNQSLTQGPENITGIRWRSGQSFTVSSGNIIIDPFEITTDIYDFNTRKEKTIFGLEVSTNVNTPLQVSIDYRVNYKGSFKTIPWININPDGRINLPCYGVEFRFHLRALTYEYFELDWIKFSGVVHGYSHLDN